MKLSINVDKSRFEAMNRELVRQMPYATSLALNNLAKRIRDEEKRQMQHVFKSPTPFTLRSVLVEWSSKRKPYARIFIRDQAHKGTAPSKYLAPEVFGAARSLKRFERALIAKRIMPKGMYAIPGEGVRLNKYGNMTQGFVRKLLDQVSSQGEQSKGSKYFVAKIKGTLGIWQRHGRGGRVAKPIIVFTRSQPTYKVRFPFHRIAAGVSRTHFKRELDKAMDIAISTARKKSSSAR